MRVVGIYRRHVNLMPLQVVRQSALSGRSDRLPVNAELFANSDESKVLSESPSATGKLEMQYELAVVDPLDDGPVMWTRARCFVAAPDTRPDRVDPPSPTLAIAALRSVSRRDDVLVGAVRPVARRDRNLARSKLSRRGASCLPVAIEQVPRRIR